MDQTGLPYFIEVDAAGFKDFPLQSGMLKYSNYTAFWMNKIKITGSMTNLLEIIADDSTSGVLGIY